MNRAVISRRDKVLDSKRVSIPPWCATLGMGYYNDYPYGYSQDLDLVRVSKIIGDKSRTIGDLKQKMECSSKQISKWTTDGNLLIE